jgi:DNA sulfur modification protein DndC
MLLSERIALIRRIYESDNTPWVVAYSGGKDSTAVLQLIWSAVCGLPPERRTKPVAVTYVDTGMDHPAYVDELNQTFRRMRSAIADKSLPIQLHILEPQTKHRYFVSVLGRGYAPPTHWFRWCTRSMRITPMSVFLRKILVKHGAVLIAMGLRRDESPARSATITRYETSRRFLGRYGSIKSAIAFTPIEDFATEDVWQLLMQMPCPWGGTNRSLSRLYTLAAGGECAPLSLGDGAGRSCGGSRFGCWTCTVVRKDKTGEALAEENPKFEHLLEFRNYLATIRSDKRRRWKTRRNGAPGPGPLTLATRKHLLGRLVQVEDATGLKLLRDDELQMIQEFWRQDGDSKNSAFEIAGWRSYRKEPVSSATKI